MIAADLRAVGEPSWTDGETIIVPVIDEHDWYLWTMRSNNMRHPSLRAVEISSPLGRKPESPGLCARVIVTVEGHDARMSATPSGLP